MTLFTPDGPGPFPLAVLNHGKELGPPKNEPRYRSPYLSQYFLSRGYAVALPMMRGFAGSEGVFDAHGQDVGAAGRIEAKDIAAVIGHLVQRPEIDGKRIVVAGQSFGGWNTLAFAEGNYPGVKGAINFCGGWKEPNFPNWAGNLIAAAGHYGARTKLPSLWFYGDNDSIFPSETWHAMYDKYVQAGGPATLVAFGVFMKDSHNLLGSLEGFPLWMPKVDAFLESVGLPGKLLTARYLPAPAPPASHFAAIDDVNAVPYLNEAGRETYRKFLTRPLPRVFIVIPRGGCAFYNGGYDPQTRGLEECRKTSPNCELYAVDNNVVWVPKEPPAVAAWRASAQAGNVEGERQLGYLYLVGHGVAPNSSESAKWIGLAASQGDLFSQGIAWQYGFGNASDLAKAHDAYQQAAAKGDTLAMYQLSRMGGNEADPAAGTGQSLDWLRKAAEGGLAMAQFRLGGLYLRLDSTQALAWFQRAADAGDAFAQNDLGYLYLKGQVTERDYGKALALFQKASDQGVLASLNEIGNMYAHGWGVPKDDVQALACFRKAAEKGFATAQYSLGFLYQSGLGIAKDDGQARAWFQRAAAQGYRPAKEALVKMDGVPSL